MAAVPDATAPPVPAAARPRGHSCTVVESDRRRHGCAHGRAAQILREANDVSPGTTPQPHEWVFPTRRGLRIDASKMGKAIRDLGIDAVPHGFRSSFRDWGLGRTCSSAGGT